MSEGEKDWIATEESRDQCQLSVDMGNRCLILEFSQQVEMFAFDVETAEGFCDAIRKGIQMLKQLDS